MSYFKWLKSNSDLAPAPVAGTAGGAIAEGDLLEISSGKVSKASTDNALNYEGVALHNAAADGDPILYMPLDPDYEFEGTVKDTSIPAIGTYAGIDITTGVQKIEGAGTSKVCVIKEVLNATAKTVRVSFLAKARYSAT